MPPINGAYPKDWGNYLTQLGNALEVVPAVLYSTKDFTSATTTTLTFFDTAAGSRLDLTNMQNAGALPSPQSFLIQNIRLFFKTQPRSDNSGAGAGTVIASEFDDLVQICNQGVLQLTIGEKRYGPWPLWMLPANSFVKGGFSTGSDLMADYGQLDGNLYPLIPNLMLATLQPFNVTLTWPAGALTLSQTTTPIQVLFDGQLARAIQ